MGLRLVDIYKQIAVFVVILSMIFTGLARMSVKAVFPDIFKFAFTIYNDHDIPIDVCLFQLFKYLVEIKEFLLC